MKGQIRIPILELIALGLLLALPCSLHAAHLLAPDPATSIVIFADQPVPPSVWNHLSQSLEQGIARQETAALHLPEIVQVLKGSEVTPGAQFGTVLVVWLHGDCTAPSGLQKFPAGSALGWVLRNGDRIDPIIHVDCTRVSQAISQPLVSLKPAERDGAMADAIGRVILHEWLHIAAQSAVHGRSGISRAQFSAEDLMGEESHQMARQRTAKNPFGF